MAAPRSPRDAPDKGKSDKESRVTSFREWINTTAGATSAVVAVVGLIAGGTVVGVKISSSPASGQTQQITPGPTTPNPTSPTPTTPGPTPPGPTTPSPNSLSTAQLENALLPVDTIGPAGVLAGPVGTDVSQLGNICGGSDQGARSTAYETIKDQQTGTVLTEALVSWDNAQDASQAVSADHQAVEQEGSCSYSNSGVTAMYSGDYQGQPPSSCASPNEYFASEVEIEPQGAISPYTGFTTAAQCGTATVSILITSDLPGVTQQTANGYLNAAIGRLESTA